MTRLGLEWTNFLFILAAHLIAAFAVVYLAVIHFSWWTVGLGLLWMVFCGVSITGGYHRLFSHSAYSASPFLRFFYLMFGAASVQNSALSWASDHRAHHAHTDREGDPYNIQRGFWWAHMGWVLFRRQGGHGKDVRLVRDLQKDPLVRFQHEHYVLLAIVFGAVIPGALGAIWGDVLGAILVTGFLRLVFQWHATFSINSLTHTFGRQPYCSSGSARDSFWIALVTMGEGYHNFHHRFQIDYRNGIRWYHYDPTKWWVWIMSKLGLARGLRRVPNVRIDAARAATRDGVAPA